MAACSLRRLEQEVDHSTTVYHLGPDSVLPGQKVSLRPPEIEDLAFIHALWTDPETMEAVGGIVDFSAEKLLMRFRRMIDPGGPKDCYCLIRNENAKPIGEVSFHDFDAENGSARLNIKVHASQRGHGYGQDALIVFLTFFFCSVGGRIMIDNVGIDNDLAKRLLLSFGFKIDDSYSDVFMMFMTREMYLTRYKASSKPPGATPDGASRFRPSGKG